MWTANLLTYGLTALIILSVTIGLATLFKANHTYLIYPALLVIFFPMNIKLLGRDAMTTGTVCVLLLFALYLLECLQKGTSLIRDRIDVVVIMLIIAETLSTVLAFKAGELSSDQLGNAVRQYVSASSALLLFLVIKNYRLVRGADCHETNAMRIERLLSFFILFVTVHILIALACRVYPPLDAAIALFYGAETESLAADRDIVRGGSFLFNPESLSEYIATLSPVVVYKVLRYRKPVWGICLALFAVGLAISVTRSGIVLFFLGVTLAIVYHMRQSFFNSLIFASGLATAFLVVLFFLPSTLADVYERFELAKSSYASNSSLFETINRDNFPEIWADITTNLSLFGHSLFRVDYHNLFLTTIQQLGVLGTVLFCSVLFYPAVLLWQAFRQRRDGDGALVFCCLVSVMLFFINELKFEFTRSASYQQLCWGLLGIYCLVAYNARAPGVESHVR